MLSNWLLAPEAGRKPVYSGHSSWGESPQTQPLRSLLDGQSNAEAEDSTGDIRRSESERLPPNGENPLRRAAPGSLPRTMAITHRSRTHAPSNRYARVYNSHTAKRRPKVGRDAVTESMTKWLTGTVGSIPTSRYKAAKNSAKPQITLTKGSSRARAKSPGCNNVFHAENHASRLPRDDLTPVNGHLTTQVSPIANSGPTGPANNRSFSERTSRIVTEGDCKHRIFCPLHRPHRETGHSNRPRAVDPDKPMRTHSKGQETFAANGRRDILRPSSLKACTVAASWLQYPPTAQDPWSTEFHEAILLAVVDITLTLALSYQARRAFSGRFAARLSFGRGSPADHPGTRQYRQATPAKV